MLKSVRRKMDIADKVLPLLKTRVPVKRLESACFKHINHYLFETKDNCSCSYCGRTFVMPKLDRHKTERFCPKCHHKVTVQRGCGARSLNEICPIMYGETVGEYLVIRYFLFERRLFNEKDGLIHSFERFREVGRQILTKGVDIRYECRYCDDKWFLIGNSAMTGNYFRERSGMFGWYENRYYIGNCICLKDNMDSMLKHINSYSLACFDQYLSEKYTDKKVITWGQAISECQIRRDYFISLFTDGVGTSYFEVFEKFYNVGLAHFVDEHSKMACFLNAKPSDSIWKILGLTKNEFNDMKENGLLTSYHKVAEYKAFCLFAKKFNISHKDTLCLAKCASSYQIPDLEKMAEKGELIKKIHYISKQKITLSEYKHYMSMLESVGAPLDNSNLYPTNFRKAEKKLVDEIEFARIEKEKETVSKCTGKMYDVANKIYKAMQTSSFIKSFTGKGLIVKIPESPEELMKEGHTLHNCLKNSYWCEHIANGDCVIFFIRKIDEPDTPYYAMEYKNGAISQLYTYNNTKDESYTEVNIFCTEFLKALETAKKSREYKKLIKTVTPQVA